jgi:hypothetical protein
MQKFSFLILLAAALLTAALPGAEIPSLNQAEFEEKMRSVTGEREDAKRLNKAQELARRHYLSSLQVKVIALRFDDDDARYDFALAAYPRTIDPENFYEVYDAFTKFSKVMRLHDRIRQLAHPVPGPFPGGPVVVHPLTERELKEMLRALRGEPFDSNRIQLAKQILSTSQGNFLSAQVRQMVECFDFEPSKLQVAKFAFDYTLDPEKYFLVQEAFSFSSTKLELSRYIQEHGRPAPRPRPR